MSVFTLEEARSRLSDLGIIMKYMPFLQEHGFSEYGKGQLTGKMEILKEGFLDSTASHPWEQSESRIGFTQADTSSFHDYRDQVVKSSGTSHIEASLNSDDSNGIGDEGKNSMDSETAERTDVNDPSGKNEMRKYLTENNKWNFTNYDESSWITRIRKLADL
jgi:hypothetical protein